MCTCIHNVYVCMCIQTLCSINTNKICIKIKANAVKKKKHLKKKDFYHLLCITFSTYSPTIFYFLIYFVLYYYVLPSRSNTCIFPLGVSKDSSFLVCYQKILTALSLFCSLPIALFLLLKISGKSTLNCFRNASISIS